MQTTKGRQTGALKCLVYGPEGIGKSTFAAHFPGAVFIDTEGSTKWLDVERYPRPLSWAQLLEQVADATLNANGIRTIIIDTADWAEKLCTEAVLAKYQKKGIEDFGYGKGYVYVGEEFGKLIDMLTDINNLGVNVVLTAHAAMRKFEQPDEMGAYDRWEMKLSKKVAPMLKEWADLVIFANYRTIVVTSGDKKKAQGGERVMYTTHHPCWDAKNRFSLPEEMPFDFKGIAHLFPGAAVMDTGNPVTKNPDTGNPVSPPRAPDPQKATPVVPPVDPSPAHVAPPPEVNRYDGVPPELEQLMRANDVTPEEIVYIVAQPTSTRGGYYPANTPIANYDPDFVRGVLVAAWDQVYGMILKARSNTPF